MPMSRNTPDLPYPESGVHMHKLPVPEFVLGAVVRLMSGGPKMTVTQIDIHPTPILPGSQFVTQPKGYLCRWFSEGRFLEDEWFQGYELKLHEDKGFE